MIAAAFTLSNAGILEPLSLYVFELFIGINSRSGIGSVNSWELPG